MIDNHGCCDTVSMDLSKAFDTIYHNLLKLLNYMDMDLTRNRYVWLKATLQRGGRGQNK